MFFASQKARDIFQTARLLNCQLPVRSTGDLPVDLRPLGSRGLFLIGGSTEGPKHAPSKCASSRFWVGRQWESLAEQQRSCVTLSFFTDGVEAAIAKELEYQ